MSGPSEVTELLRAHEGGDTDALGRLLPIVYDELRGLARRVWGGQGGARTLQPTALAHEAWIKLSGGMREVRGRHHFFAVAARAMRQVLADHGRARKADKRNPGGERVTLTGLGAERETDLDLLALHEALERLSGLHARHADVVALRFLGGLTIAETAEVLDLSTTTVESDWAAARAWLALELSRN